MYSSLILLALQLLTLKFPDYEAVQLNCPSVPSLVYLYFIM